MSYPSYPYGGQPGGQTQGTSNPFGGIQPGRNYGGPPKPGQQMMTGDLGGLGTPAPPTSQMRGLSIQPGGGTHQQWHNQQHGNQQIPGQPPPPGSSMQPGSSGLNGQPPHWGLGPSTTGGGPPTMSVRPPPMGPPTGSTGSLPTGPPTGPGTRPPTGPGTRLPTGPGAGPPTGPGTRLPTGPGTGPPAGPGTGPPTGPGTGPPTGPGMGPPPTLLGSTSMPFGPPPTGTGIPPSSVVKPPVSSVGPPPSGTGQLTSIPPLMSTGGPPTSVGLPPTSVGPPISSVRPPAGTGFPPSGPTMSVGPPLTSGGIPSTTTHPPGSFGAPPTGQPPSRSTGYPQFGGANTSGPPGQPNPSLSTIPGPPTSSSGPVPSVVPPPGVHPGGPSGPGVPPTGGPPTGVPPTGVPPTGVPPTGGPPTGGLPTGPPTMLGQPPRMGSYPSHHQPTTGTSLAGPPGQSIYRGQGPPPGPGAPPPMGPPTATSQPMTSTAPGMSMAGPPMSSFPGGSSGGPQPGGFPPQPGSAPFQQQLPEELRPCNLLENRNILPSEPLTHPTISLPGDYSRYQPDPNIISSTLNVVPVTHSLLSKMKLPFGIHVHPYRQHSSKIIPILHPSVIVRCRVCRTYINPYVTFIDSRHWRCNLCFRPNDLPEDFNYNPQTGEQGRGHRKELVYTTVEYIASSEYMLRPPQPCTYFYVIDVSHNAVTSGMLATVCATLLENLDRLPGDSRTLFGLMTFDRNIHFYNMLSSLAQFQMMTVSDLDDVFLPVPGSLLVNLKENKEMIKNVLEELPKMFAQNAWIDSALGAAMSAACKILSPVGGRISVFTASTPSVGPGATKPHLTAESKSSVSKEKLKVAPATDFYKKIALECYTQQTGIDLFFFSQQPIGYASVACAAQVSSGQVYYYPGFHSNDTATRDRFVMDLIRYLTRPVGFEAVMRIRCTQGLGLHAFHGNFFVRSSDLLSLPNVSPDMGYAVNLSIDESLKDLQMVCIQTALLYTSSKGERRIRVHSIALPVSDKPADIYAGCNVQAMTGLLAKMGADKIANASLGDAREALMNAIVDCIKAYKSNMNSSGFLSLPASLRLFPLFTLALMKHPAFSLDARTTVDARADAMNTIKTLPLDALLVHIYPHLYCLNSLTEEKNMKDTKSGSLVVPERLHSTAAKLQRSGIYLVDCGSEIMIWVGQGCSPEHLQSVFGIGTYPDVDDTVHSLTPLDNPLSRIVTALIRQLKRTQTKMPRVRIVKEQSQTRYLVADRLVEDKTEGGFSYQEFLQHIQKQFKK